MTGLVTLVGAGPGDKGLLTLAGAEALRAAEAVVFDRLVDPSILALIPAGAEMVDVGKRQGSHPVPQDEINRVLVRLAESGKNTVRLKGGDCYLFGRGGEECEYLREHGVPFRVIPGVTSALAAPAFAGIPVTHRNFASSVHLITAHARAGKPLEIDFEALVRLRGTLVFFMGLAALSDVMRGLIAAGIDPETPAAVIENGARARQRKVVATASSLTEAVRAAAVQSPALIVVGPVCGLSDALDWFSALPLFGKTVAVTRPRDRAGTLSDRLRALGAEVVECPVIETRAIEDGAALSSALRETWNWVVLTSPAGVPAMVRALTRQGRDLRALYGCRFAVIGKGTEAALAKLGVRADLCPARYDGAHLARALVAAAKPGDRVLLLRAKEGSPSLPDALRAAGLPFADVPVYETVYREEGAEALRALLAAGRLYAATFTSASTVTGFVRVCGGAPLSGFTAVCIGEQTAKAARAHGMRVQTAKNATIDDLIACLMEGNKHV